MDAFILLVNSLFAICFFVNFTTIIRKIVKGEDYKLRLLLGSVILVWFVYYYTALMAS